MFRRTVLSLFVLVLCASAVSHARDRYSETKVQSWSFDPGGKIELRARFGDLRVVPSDSSEVSIAYTLRSSHEEFLHNVVMNSEADPSKILIRLEAPRNGSVDIELRVPAQSNLLLRVSAGDISIGAVEGDKNVETHAGDIRIELPLHSDLGLVDASTHAGDVTAPFGKRHGWIGGSLRYEGVGKYRLHAHTFAGDVNLREQARAGAEAIPDHP